MDNNHGTLGDPFQADRDQGITQCVTLLGSNAMPDPRLHKEKSQSFAVEVNSIWFIVDGYYFEKPELTGIKPDNRTAERRVLVRRVGKDDRRDYQPQGMGGTGYPRDDTCRRSGEEQRHE